MESITNSKDEITCTSTSDEKDKINMIFQNNDKSRFDFVNNNEEENNIIPKIYIDIINEKYKIKNIEHLFKNSDLILFNNSKIQNDIQKDNELFNYLINENNKFEKDEFQIDFENINNFILEQTSKV